MVSSSPKILALIVALSCMGLGGLVQPASAIGGHLQKQDRGSSAPASNTSPTQNTNVSDNVEEKRPLPEIDQLMREVEARQKAAEAIQKDYLYHATDLLQQLDGHGRVKKTQSRGFDVFWVEGVPVYRLVMKDGRGLDAEEQKKETQQIDKQVARAKERRARADAKGKTTDPDGYEEVTVSRLLELGSFSNARRVKCNGRETIAVDFVGDPRAKTRNRLENVIRDMAGTIWVDEDDRAIVRIEGHFLNTFKIGAGLLVNIQKGTSFSMEQRKVNDEVWLPVQAEGRGAARMLLLFNFNGTFREVDSGYRKFKVTSTILPGIERATQ